MKRLQLTPYDAAQRPRQAVALAVAALVTLATVALALLPPAAQAQTPEARAPEVETPEGQASSQDSPAGAVFDTLDVNVVNVEVWATDRKGDPVTDLEREDFTLLVGGQPVPITNFYAEASGEAPPQPSASVPVREVSGTPERLEPLEETGRQPMRVVVFVDNTQIRPPNRKKVFNALRTFLDQHLEEGDSVMIAGLSPTLRIYSDFIRDRQAIENIVDQVEETAGTDFSLEFERRRVLSSLTRMDTTASRGGSLNPAVNAPALLASIRAYAEQQYQKGLQSLRVMTAFVETLAGVPGRKAFLLVSDGIPTNPGEELYTSYQENFAFNDALGTPAVSENDYQREIGNYDLLPQFRELSQSANGAQVTIYPIDAEGDGPQRLRGAALEGELSTTMLSIAENNYREPMELAAQRTGGRRLQARPQLSKDLELLAQDFGNYYSLGFEAEARDEPQRIEVKVDRPGVRVRHREDVVLRSQDVRSADTTVATLLFNETQNPLDIELQKGEAQRREDGKLVLPVEVSIPVKELTLIPSGDTHNAQLSFYVSVRAADGSTRPVQKIPFHLPIPADKVEEAKGERARYPLPVVLEPGDQQIAITVRDDLSAEESTLRLELPSAASQAS